MGQVRQQTSISNGKRSDTIGNMSYDYMRNEWEGMI
jgi:hypothetical protein